MATEAIILYQVKPQITCICYAEFITLKIGTNLIHCHNISVKLAVFREYTHFREICNFSAFTFIYEGFQSFIIQQLLCCFLSE